MTAWLRAETKIRRTSSEIGTYVAKSLPIRDDHQENLARLACSLDRVGYCRHACKMRKARLRPYGTPGRSSVSSAHRCRWLQSVSSNTYQAKCSHRSQSAKVVLRIEVHRVNIPVPQEIGDVSQWCSFSQQLRRAGMAKRVGTEVISLNTESFHAPLHGWSDRLQRPVERVLRYE